MPAAAERFLRAYAAELELEHRLESRLGQVLHEIERTGSYTHTSEELTHGARMAWRNHARCIGRLTWKSLTVFDERQTEGAEAVFEACRRHLTWSGNGGRIRPAVTVFRPRKRGRADVRIHNRQLISYAGFDECGDPLNRPLTRKLQERGWQADPAPFVPLPIWIDEQWFELPREEVLEVPLCHPERDEVASWKLRWYALPAVSNLELEIGGIVYPAAPFSGYYMLTEVGSRDLGDHGRYDLLPRFAELFGFAGLPLWQDRAVTELNRTVLHSFARAGVSMVDHHTASEQFVRFCAHERQAGREVSAQWSWIVPPAASSSTEVFFTPMKDLGLSPAFRARPQ